MSTTKRPEDRSCFFISPIGEVGGDIRKRSDTVKRLIVEAALVPDLVARVARADEDPNPGEITPAIITAILDTDLVVADLTGANPNVFYEVAVAHAYGKPTVHIRLSGEDIPFDLKDVRVFEYGLDLETGDKARAAIAAAARDVLDKGKVARTPISGATTLLSAQQSSDSSDQIAAEVLTRMSDLETSFERLSRQVRAATGENGELSTAEARLSRARDRHVSAIAQLQHAEAILEDAHDEGAENLEELARAVRSIRKDVEANMANLEAAEASVQSILLSMRRHPSRSQAWRNAAAQGNLTVDDTHAG